MKSGTRLFAAILAGCAMASPAAQGDGGPLPPAPGAHKAKPAPKPAPSQAPLNPGQSAGVRAAQQGRTGLALIGAGGAIIAVIAVTASSGGGNGSAQPKSQAAPATTG